MPSRYRAQNRASGHEIQELQNGRWIRCCPPYKNKSTASAKLSRLRLDESREVEKSIGSKLMASFPFCAWIKP